MADNKKEKEINVNNNEIDDKELDDVNGGRFVSRNGNDYDGNGNLIVSWDYKCDYYQYEEMRLRLWDSDTFKVCCRNCTYCSGIGSQYICTHPNNKRK